MASLSEPRSSAKRTLVGWFGVRRAGVERDLSATIDLPAAAQRHLERHLVAGAPPAAQRRWARTPTPAALVCRRRPVPAVAVGRGPTWSNCCATTVVLKALAPDAMAARLVTAGIVERQPDGSSVWDIYVGGQATSSTSLKLASPSLLLSATHAAATPMVRQLLKAAVSDTTVHPRPADAQLALPIPEPRLSQPIATVASTQPRPREQSLASPVASPPKAWRWWRRHA
jgi:hypothetical protein